MRLDGDTRVHDHQDPGLYSIEISPLIKFAATKMYKIALDLGLTNIESTIDFIQGRKPRKVLAVNYLEPVALADTLYPHYAE
jgi:intergrase/recombinase